MHPRFWVRGAVAGCVALLGAWTQSALLSAAEVRPKPNLIFIMADDMGVDWVSAYGASHRTPHIDRLAGEGIRFTSAWCAPICTPTRIELLSGQYPFRSGWTVHHDVPRWGGKGFDWEKFTCWARVLREAGYATAVGGKWQVNDFREYPDALERHGFDEHCMWTGYETGNAPPSNERYWDAYLITNGKRTVHEGQFGPAVINDFLVDFIRRNKDRPFLVYYPMLMPHGPHVPTPLNKDDPPGDQKGLYAGMVTCLDQLVGRITDTVDRLGLAENTVIIFTCDNGSSVAGNLEGKPYAKGKGRVANCGAHVPFVVRAPRWAGQRAGRVSDELVDFTDVYPTFLELAGATVPEGTTLDGRSIVGLLDGSAGPSRKRTWIYAQLGGGRMVRDQRYLLDSRGGFYDLLADPLQQNNLAESADPTAVAARQRLGAVLGSMPADAAAPFEGFRGMSANKSQPQRKKQRQSRRITSS